MDVGTQELAGLIVHAQAMEMILAREIIDTSEQRLMGTPFGSAFQRAHGVGSGYSSGESIKVSTVGKYGTKYLKVLEGVPVEHGICIPRLIENVSLYNGAVCYLTESKYGADSPKAWKIMIRENTVERKKGEKRWISS